MKNRKIFIMAFSLQILLCLFLDWGGQQLAYWQNWPLWLDSIGTALAAYFAGPWCGAVVGATFNLLIYILYGNPWYYALTSVIIAIYIGFATRKKMMETLLGTLTAGTILAVITSVCSYPVNLILNQGDTGNAWGNAVIGFLGEAGIPVWSGLFVGELYVELPDKLISLGAIFVISRIVQRLRKKSKGRGKNGYRSGPLRGIALLIAAGMCFAGAGSAVLPARAEEEGLSGDINYNDYVQTVYSSTNGLPCGEANDIAITGDGIIWIGTYAGLYRYNGREFKWMDGFDSVRNVNCLYVDEEGRLWIGTNDNGLSIVINEQVVNVIDQSQGLPSNSVKSIIRSSDGYYYIGTTGSMQILTLNCGLKKLSTLSEVAYADHVTADDKGNVVAVTNEGTLFLLQQGQIISSRQLPERQTVFRSCTFDPEGYLLAATSGNEVFRFDVSKGWFDLKSTIECPGLVTIKNLHFLDNGGLFICADNGIAYVNTAGVYERINTNDFNNSIDNMMMDYQGNLWFTSSRLGLLRLAASDFRDIYSTAGMENRVANTVVQWNGTYYFGTDKGMDAVDLKGMNRVSDAVTERFNGVRIRCMIVDTQDHLWVCTYGNGLVEIEPDGTEYVYNRDNGAFGNRARVVKQLRDGTVLAAGDTGLSYIRDHMIEHTIVYTEGRISSMVLTITEMADGTILAGTDGNGLAVIENGEVVRMLTRVNGLSSEVILRTVPDTKTGGVFVVTSNGLCYMNTDETIRKLDNFPYFNNYDIWIKGTDSLFVLSSAGIYTVDRNELLSGKDEISYDLLDSRRGLNSSLTANAWTWYNEDNGELYLPCDTGVFVINTNTFSSGAKVYRLSVPTMKMDGTLHRVDRSVTQRIPRGVSRLEIYPEVINYTIQDPNVGYMLEGFENEWTVVPQNSLGTISYTNLSAGDYVFHLAVFDNNRENVVAERTYNISKEKEMYDNSWFIFYILSVPMFTVGWVTWLLVKRHERKMQEQLAMANKQIEMGKQTVIAIARTVDAKDQRTSDHSKRVAIYSAQIAKAYGLDEKQCRDIEWSAQMHDIGKIGIPDAILNKPARLTDDEYSTMKSHTTRGAEILKDFTLLDNVIDGAQYHHERYDGRGYPKGLKGEEIPLFARIIGVADAFDAMTANRIYRQQMDFSYVLGEMQRCRGTQFDPKFVDILLKLIHDGTIDLNMIYHVPKEESDQAEKDAALAQEEKAREAGPTAAPQSFAEIKNNEQGGKA
ncbi:MAG: HD domain-containing protein [Clostridia bacterium]|nr:HD domain-containing protein [Clostridia bacterium]